MNNLRNYLSQRIEVLKCCVVEKSITYHLAEVERLLEWQRKREVVVVESALDKTLDCGYVHGIEDKR